MLYTLLGRIVWRVARLVARRKLRRSRVSKPVLGIAAAATVAGALIVLQRRDGD